MTVIHAGDYALEEALTYPEPAVRMFGRLAASEVSEELGRWLAAEFARAETEPADVFLVLARWAAQTHASLAAQFFPREAVPVLLKMFNSQLAGEYQVVFDKTIAILDDRRKVPT